MERALIELFFAISILGLFTLIAKFFPIIEKYKIPISLVSSVFVLTIFTIFSNLKNQSIFSAWKSWPSELIAVIFASLFLERSEDQNKSNLKEILSEGSLVWLSILGQTIIAIFLTIFFFQKFYEIPSSFAMILETGFAGGHGTAFVMQDPLEKSGLKGGLEFGLFSATVGLIGGVVGGIFLIIKEKKQIDQIKIETETLQITVSQLILSSAFISTAFLFGKTFHFLSKTYLQQIPVLPLFIYALFGSMILKLILKITNSENLLQNQSNSLVASIVMEFLIFTGIATMDLNVIVQFLSPLLILFFFGFLWNLFCHFVLSKKLIHKNYRFELSLINFGMLNGTTATGLMLWKMADPLLKSKAPKVYASAAPLSSPFIGGGMLTLTLPYLLVTHDPKIILSFLVGFWFMLFFLARKYLG